MRAASHFRSVSTCVGSALFLLCSTFDGEPDPVRRNRLWRIVRTSGSDALEPATSSGATLVKSGLTSRFVLCARLPHPARRLRRGQCRRYMHAAVVRFPCRCTAIGSWLSTRHGAESVRMSRACVDLAGIISSAPSGADSRGTSSTGLRPWQQSCAPFGAHARFSHTARPPRFQSRSDGIQ